MTTINTLNKTEARAACKKAGISYTNMTVADMRAALEAHAQISTPVEPEAAAQVEAAEPEVIEQRTDDAPVVTTPPADPAPVVADPLCAVCDHIEKLHTLGTSTHAFTPKPAAAVESTSAKPVKAPKAPAAPKNQRNGITRPGPGKCLDVWTHLDALKAAGKEITFEELRKTIDPSTADATLRTQRQRWKTYNA